MQVKRHFAAEVDTKLKYQADFACQTWIWHKMFETQEKLGKSYPYNKFGIF